MLIVLPPSETKAPGGSLPAGEPLHFPELDPIREELTRDLIALCTEDPEAAMQVLGLSEKLRGEVEANQVLRTAPTMPALRRYTGVLYDALDVTSLADATTSHLAIGSALYGLVMGGDPIPHYRLSGGTKLTPGTTMKKRWGSVITEALQRAEQEHGLVVDLRSGAYQQLGKLKTAVTVRVESVQPDGSRKVVSHFNKHYKGLLARALAQDPSGTTATEVADIARAAGFAVEQNSTELTLVV